MTIIFGNLFTIGTAEGTAISEEEQALTEDLLNLLGEQATVPNTSDSIHPEVAQRWKPILKKGLDAELKSKLLAKYPPLENCIGAFPPQVNPEIKGAATEAALHRDERIVDQQTLLSASLSAIGKVLTLSLPSAGEDNEFHHICEAAGDAARLIAYAFFSHSQCRRILQGTGLNSKFKMTLNDAHTHTPVALWDRFRRETKKC